MFWASVLATSDGGTKTAVEMKFYDEVNIYVCMYVCTHGQDREIDDKMIEYVNKNVVKKKTKRNLKEVL